MIRKILDSIGSFFPIQLLLLHFKKSQIQLLIWLFLFACVGGFIAKKYGIHYLFLTPEYLDTVDIWSYVILGLANGLFIIAFHVSCYVRYSFRFPFLATLNRAFFKFCLNNSIIPFLFIVYYLHKMISHHYAVAGTGTIEILLMACGFLGGTAFMISLCMTYFFTANRGIMERVEEKLDKPLKLIVKKNKSDGPVFDDKRKSPRTYLRSWFQPTRVRRSDHYRKEHLMGVFQEHHRNASFFTLLIILLLVALSVSRELPVVMIPAASTIFILAGIYTLLTGAIYSWFKGWTSTIIIVGLIGFNLISAEFPEHRINHAYGLNYDTTKVDFSYEVLDSLTDLELLKEDKQHMLEILENWKAKQGSNKPKLVFINTSGGGLRSTLWSFDVIQFADSITNGRFFNATHLITGSSGGMIGAAYFRELNRPGLKPMLNSLYSSELRKPLTRDILNPVTFSFAVNDLFIKFLKFKDGKYTYSKDRGYAWEQKLIRNTGLWQQARLRDYKEEEQTASIPLMILAPSIINEGRRLIISSQPMSYMGLVYPFDGEKESSSYDGIEFKRMFAHQDAENLRFTSALRMSASFPIITPLVTLPSDPPIRTIDAGVRDNSGFELSLRFMYNFKEWIRENTSGVVFVQIQADRPQKIKINNPGKYKASDDFTEPLTGVYNSFINMQRFQQEYLKQLMAEWTDVDVDFIHFQLLDQNTEVSLSWHLTNLEKRRVYNSIYNPNNWEEFKKLKQLLMP